MPVAQRRKVLGLAASIAAVAMALGLAAPGLADEPIACSYIEAGPAGPPGNVLRIEDGTRSVTHIYREGDAIVVFNNANSDPTVCNGGAPTVFNVDTIEFIATANSAPFIDYIGPGPLAPGATPESNGSEIEISVREAYHPEVLNVAATPGADSIVAGQLGPHLVGVNLNAQADGPEPDADMTLYVRNPAEATVRVIGRDGNDRMSALGGPGFSGPFPADRLTFAGGDGNDALLGGPHDDHLSGNEGDDTLLGGRGHDLLKVGPGRDLAKGGMGPDRIEDFAGAGGIPDDTTPDHVDGGPGNDAIDMAQFPSLRGDVVECGSGPHDSADVNRGDRASGCEHLSVER